MWELYAARANAALPRPGRYRQVRRNLQAKEVPLPGELAEDRFIVCFNSH
jgi:hypothetical protein